MIAASAVSPGVHESDLEILGTRPHYGPPTVSTVPDLAAAGPLLWVPGLDQGWDPQGLAVIDGNLMVSAYRSDRFGANRGPCRVFRVDPATGRVTGRFDLPPACGHAGGLAYAGDGTLYIADTHTLFAVDLDKAFADQASQLRSFPLGPGLKGAFAASGWGEIWIGTYEEDRPGRIFKYDLSVLRALPDRAMLTRELAATELIIPSYAQGAAISSGRLWISRSELAWGSLEELDPASGLVVERYPAPGGIEGIAFDAAGGLWAVSEAGARHFPLRYPFFPVIFRLDVRHMSGAARDR